MSTEAAFGGMLKSFMDEIEDIFPGHPKFPEYTHITFVEQIRPWANQLMAKDPGFFCVENNFAKETGLNEIWVSENCSDVTKSAIWQYIQSLYMVGTTMSILPPDTMKMVESIAEKFVAGNVVNGQLDEASLMKMMTQMMSGGGGLAGLLQTPSLQSPKSKKSKKKIGPK